MSVGGRWLVPTAELSLTGDLVHLWRARLDLEPRQIQHLQDLLSVDELESAYRFHFERDRNRFIAARGILRTILARYLGLGPDTLCFYYGEAGKPSLCLPSSDRDLDLRFNLSHSHGIALYAVSCGREVGIDVEWMRPDFPYEEIAARFFTRAEAAYLRGTPDPMRPRGFMELWTRKEAHLKALGCGLSGLMDQAVLPAGSPEVPGSQIDSRWTAQLVDVVPEYIAAVVVEGDTPAFACWQWSEAWVRTGTLTAERVPVAGAIAST